MRRKVVKHGPSTLIVSIPVKWAKRHGVKPGAELDVEEKGKTLMISTEASKDPGSVEMDVSKLDRTSIILYVRSMYRRGYKEINIRFSKGTAHHFRTGKDVNIISIIHEEVNRLIGMEVIEEKRNMCVIKEITESSDREFDNIYRKVYFQLEEAMEDMILNLRKNDLTALSTIEEKHDTITRFISYCIRLLNQGKVKNPDISPHLYNMLISVDFITEILKYFARDVILLKHAFKKESIDILDSIVKVVSLYSRMQFKSDADMMWDFQKDRDIIRRSLRDAMKKSKDDFVFVNYMASILETLKLMSEPMLFRLEKAE